MARRRTRASLGSGSLVPLLDVLFLLIFALLALSDTRETEREELVHIQLPGVEPGDDPPTSKRTRIALAIGADSTVHVVLEDVEREVLSWEELDTAIGELLGDGLPEEVTIELRADRDAKHGIAVELLQHLRLRGFVDVQLLATGAASDSWGSAGEGR